MADLNPETLLFRGTSPEECEMFVAAVRQRALANEKHLDNQWIAFLASSHLVGDAFYWFESLDEETQNDWRRLRPALVARFGRGAPPSTLSASATPVSALPMTIPTPAAAASAVTPLSSVRKGRLGVWNLSGSFRGYLQNRADSHGVYRFHNRDGIDALVVSIASSLPGKVFELQIEGNNTLAICWPGSRGTRWMDDSDYAGSFCPSDVASTTDWPVEREVWKISEDGELRVEYPKPDGSTESLRPYEIMQGAKIVWLKINHNITMSLALKVVFEDIN